MATWRECVGFPAYEVSDDGRVRRAKPGQRTRVGREMKPHIDKAGRPVVGLRRDGNYKLIRVSVLMAEAFIGPRPDGLICCHNDGNPSNNVLNNLRWGTYSSNAVDRARHGTAMFGAKNHKTKLTSDEVAEIRRLYSTGLYRQADLGEMFGVSQPQIGNITRCEQRVHG